MRLLFLSNYYPPLHIGGYEELCADVAERLRARGHRVLILTTNTRAHEAPAEEDVERRLHPEVSAGGRQAALGFFMGRQRRLAESLAVLDDTLRAYQPDAIVVWGMWNLPRPLFARLEEVCGERVVYYLADYAATLPDAYSLHWSAPARRPYMTLAKRAIGRLAGQGSGQAQPPLRFEHVLSVSEALRQQLRREGLALPNAVVVHNGIELAPFLAAARPRRAEASSPLRVLYAGRLAPEKGVHTAVAAVARLIQGGTDIRLTIVGRGSADYEQALRDKAAQQGMSEQVRLLSPVPRSEMPSTLAQFDVLVCPSVWAEPLPRIVQEAMAAGLVVVGTPVGGMPEILHHEVNGLVFDPNDVQGLATQLRRLALEPGLRVRLTEAARLTVCQDYDLERTVDEIEQYVRQMVVAA